MRAQIINDAFALSESLEIPSTQPLEIIKYLTQETEYLPWSTSITRLNYLTNMLDSTSAFTNYQNFIIKLVSGLYNSLGWDEGSSDTYLLKYFFRVLKLINSFLTIYFQRQFRAKILSLACERDFIQCVNKAKSWFASWMQNENNNPLDNQKFISKIFT